MKRPPATWLLILALTLLALGGFAGAYGFLSDPTGAGMGMTETLAQLPVADFALPGLFLLVFMALLPLALIYGLLVRPNWRILRPIERWSRHAWAWTGSLILGLGLAVWLVVQAALIGFAAPIQWFTAGLGALLLFTCLWPSTRAFFRMR